MEALINAINARRTNPDEEELALEILCRMERVRELRVVSLLPLPPPRRLRRDAGHLRTVLERLNGRTIREQMCALAWRPTWLTDAAANVLDEWSKSPAEEPGQRSGSKAGRALRRHIDAPCVQEVALQHLCLLLLERDPAAVALVVARAHAAGHDLGADPGLVAAAAFFRLTGTVSAAPGELLEEFRTATHFVTEDACARDAMLAASAEAVEAARDDPDDVLVKPAV